jgi:hypothetical protein
MRPHMLDPPLQIREHFGGPPRRAGQIANYLNRLKNVM